MNRVIVRFVLSALVAFILASIFHSQFILAGLEELGTEITFADRLQMTFSDLIGLLPGYGSVIALALVIGFLVINAIHRWCIPLAKWRYPLAGFIAIAAALQAMQPLLDVTLIASARTPMGFLFQCFAGAAGGIVFALLQKENSPR